MGDCLRSETTCGNSEHGPTSEDQVVRIAGPRLRLLLDLFVCLRLQVEDMIRRDDDVLNRNFEDDW